MSVQTKPTLIKGRGALSNPAGRFEHQSSEFVDDGWGEDPTPDTQPATQLFADKTRNIIARNQSPDVPFDQSINPYKGCEHGCVYCFARPSHAYLDLSPGIDFETKIFYKTHVPERLVEAFSQPGLCLQPDRDGREHRSVSAGRKAPADHAPDPRPCCASGGIRCRSSRKARWCCATSICCANSRRWGSRRSRSA